MALRSDDALAAAHAAMLLGATLPRLYGAAAELSHRLTALQRTRLALVRRRAEAAHNAAVLAAARNEVDQLLAMKSREADEADARFGDLAAKLDAASSQAADLEALLRRVATLRAAPEAQKLVVVAARDGHSNPGLEPGVLRRPVVGRIVMGDGADDGAPGISFLAPSAAQVIAPTDSKVLFAGRYHNPGQVLILQTLGGYDLVLAGIERVSVRSGDLLLAGEPVGRMPRSGTESRLYFELRHNGKGVSPAPWLEVELRKVNKS
jgi:septal ring factor EnvC (AmiA/AmiB activator)